MKYLVEYYTEADPGTLRAVTVDPIGGCTSGELWGEVARAASRKIGVSATFVAFAYYESNEGAEANARHCYPKEVPA